MGPPLLARAPSRGLIVAAVPTWLPLVPLVNPVMPVPSPMRSLPPEIDPSMSGALSPVMFPATMVLSSAVVALLKKRCRRRFRTPSC